MMKQIDNFFNYVACAIWNLFEWIDSLPEKTQMLIAAIVFPILLIIAGLIDSPL